MKTTFTREELEAFPTIHLDDREVHGNHPWMLKVRRPGDMFWLQQGTGEISHQVLREGRFVEVPLEEYAAV